jgi:RND family efflux transporter MFP subunit
VTSNPSSLRSGSIAALAAGIVVAAICWQYTQRLSSRTALETRTKDAAVLVVKSSYPKSGSAVEEVVLPGTVRGMSETPIYARTNGYISSWRTDIGTRVKAGELLAIIDAPEIDRQALQAEADLKTAETNASLAKVTSERIATLAATQFASKQDADNRATAALASASQVNSNQANVGRLHQLQVFERVVAPFSGTITSRSIDVGALVNGGGAQGFELFRIIDTSKLRIFVNVPQTYASQIQVGTPADLRFPERPDKSYSASVTRTASAIDPQARTLNVELDIDNSTGELFPGSFTRVYFKLAASSLSLRLSANSLLFRADGLKVAVVDANDRVVLKAVTLGRDFGSEVEVIAGVGVKDRVILNPPASIETGNSVIDEPTSSAPFS